jgi:hypothetical protein
MDQLLVVSQYRSTPIGKKTPGHGEGQRQHVEQQLLHHDLLRVGGPARAIIWRWVQNVEAPMPMTMRKATIRTVVMLAPSSEISEAGAVEGGADRRAQHLRPRALLQLLRRQPVGGVGVGLEVADDGEQREEHRQLQQQRQAPEIGLALFSL